MKQKLILLRSFLFQYYNQIAIFFIIILCLGIYHRVGELEFFLDDNSAIINNKFVARGVEGIPDLLTTTLWRGDTTLAEAVYAYRPLTMISFAVNYEFSELNPIYYHWTQLIIYIFLCIFSYLTLRELTGQEKKHVAVISSVIFAIHPVHTEVVCNLKSRDELLSLFFSILALYNIARHIRTNNIIYRHFAALLYPLGLFSKESSVVFLGIIPLTYYFFSSERPKGIIKNTIPFSIGFIIFMIIRYWVLSRETLSWVPITHYANPLLLIDTWSRKWGTILYINGKYLQLMIFPYQLTFSYFYDDIPFIDIWHWKALLTLFAYSLIGFYIFNNFKSKNIGAYGLLCYLAGLSIFSHVIIPFGNAMGERLTFTMSWGWCLFAGYIVSRLPYMNFSAYVKIATFILITSIFAFFIYKSYTRVPNWKNLITLCQTDEKVSPKSVFINGLLSPIFYQIAISSRQFSAIVKAEKYIKNFLMIDSLNPHVWIRGGHVLLLKGDYVNAEIFLNKGLNIAMLGYQRTFSNLEYIEKYWDIVKNKNMILYYPTLGYAYKHIGEVFFNVRNYPRAIACFEAAMPYMKSQLGKFYVNRDLGASYLMLNEYQKAIEYFSKADSILSDDYFVYNGLGNAYFRLKDYKSANKYFEQAFKKHKTLEIINNLIATNQLLGDSLKVAYYRGLIPKQSQQGK